MSTFQQQLDGEIIDREQIHWSGWLVFVLRLNGCLSRDDRAVDRAVETGRLRDVLDVEGACRVLREIGLPEMAAHWEMVYGENIEGF